MPEYFNPKTLYEQIKNNEFEYKEEVHCPLVLQIMSTIGSMSGFCKEAKISMGKFYRWAEKYPIFSECYQVGRMIAQSNWEKDGMDGLENPEFKAEIWRFIGSSRYGYGRDRVRVAIDPQANPHEQYKQLCLQGSMGEFNASELKQLMETINIGLRAYESFDLQNQVDEMKSSLEAMKVNHNGQGVSTIVSIKEADKNSVHH